MCRFIIIKAKQSSDYAWAFICNLNFSEFDQNVKDVKKRFGNLIILTRPNRKFVRTQVALKTFISGPILKFQKLSKLSLFSRNSLNLHTYGAF